MSLWKRLLDLAGTAFHPVPSPDSAQDPCSPDVGDTDFAAAIVALAAKMARADGRTTLDEAAAFRAAFPIAPEEQPLFDRLFALAQETVHGYEGYAKRIGRRYASKPCLLEDVLDILFAVAKADGAITEGEEEYLVRVSELFGFSKLDYARISAPYFPEREPDPYTVLGVHGAIDEVELRRAYTKLISENHPDTFIARGAPIEFIKAAHEKTAAINAAYASIKAAGPSRRNYQRPNTTQKQPHQIKEASA